MYKSVLAVYVPGFTVIERAASAGRIHYVAKDCPVSLVRATLVS